jgi:hypothetical protein
MVRQNEPLPEFVSEVGQAFPPVNRRLPAWRYKCRQRRARQPIARYGTGQMGGHDESRRATAGFPTTACANGQAEAPGPLYSLSTQAPNLQRRHAQANRRSARFDKPWSGPEAAVHTKTHRAESECQKPDGRGFGYRCDSRTGQQEIRSLSLRGDEVPRTGCGHITQVARNRVTTTSGHASIFVNEVHRTRLEYN